MAGPWSTTPIPPFLIATIGGLIVMARYIFLLCPTFPNFLFFQYYKNNNDKDLYLFAHHLNYTQALQDYSYIGGKIPVFPRYAHGVWWTRWFYMTDNDVQVCFLLVIDQNKLIEISRIKLMSFENIPFLWMFLFWIWIGTRKTTGPDIPLIHTCFQTLTIFSGRRKIYSCHIFVIY